MKYDYMRDTHLCCTCTNHPAECPAKFEDIQFGTGRGHDNVVKCKMYQEAKDNGQADILQHEGRTS